MTATTTNPSTISTSRCAIEECPIAISRSQLMCAGHWRLVPRPIQQEIYSIFRKHRGGAAHVAAIRRAVATVRKTLDGWAASRAAKSDGPPGWLPYRDD